MRRWRWSEICVILICGCVRLAGQATPTATWTGEGGDNNWSTGGNWSWQGDNGQCEGTAPGTFVGLVPGNICFQPDVVIPGGFVVNDQYTNFMSAINNFTLGAGSSLNGGMNAQGDVIGVNAQGNVTIAAGAVLTGEVTAGPTSNGVLTNQGTIIGGAFAGVVSNSGAIKLEGNGLLADSQGINSGTIEATSMGSSFDVPGASSLSGPWINAGGTIQVDSGATLICDATVTGGSFNVANGGAVAGAGGGLTIAGTVNATSFTIDGPGGLGPATVTINGTLAISGNLVVGKTSSVSKLIVNSGGSLTVTGGNTTLAVQQAAEGQLTVSGHATTGNLIVGAAGTGYVSVPSGATVTAANVTVGNAPFSSGSGQLVVGGGAMNYANLSVLQGVSPAVWVYGGGKLLGTASSGSQFTPDVLEAAALVTGSGSVWMAPNGLVLEDTAGPGGGPQEGDLTVSGGGGVTISCGCSGTYFQVETSSSATVTGAGSTLTSGNAEVDGNFTVTGGANAKLGSLTVVGVAIVTVEGAGSQLAGTNVLIEGGSVTAQSQATFAASSVWVNGILSGSEAPLTAQTGGVVSVGSLLNVSFGSAVVQTGGALQFTGSNPTLRIGAGTDPGVLTFSGSGSNAGTLSGITTVSIYYNGTLRIAGGDSIDVPTQVAFYANASGLQLPGGVIDVSNGALGIGSVSQSPPIQQGWVTIGPGGTLKGGEICPPLGTNGIDTCTPDTLVDGPGTVDGFVVNAGGDLRIDPTVLNVTQNFQQSSGTLALQIDGRQSAQVSQLITGGSIQITGGTVEFDFANGFAPSSGDSFNVLSAPSGLSVSGANFTTTGVASGFNYTTGMNAGQFTLTATNSGTATTSPPAPPPTPTLTSVDAASSATTLAPGSLASGYGNDLATGQPATATYIWPTTINNTSVTIVDATGTTSQAPVLYVSPTLVNYQIPDTVALGPATATVTATDGTMSSGPINVVPYAPGLFEVNTAGLSASFADCVSASGQQTTVLTSQVVSGALVPLPLNLGACQETVLELWSTGLDAAAAGSVQATIGNQTATVLYAGPQGTYPGVDQVNVVIPQSLAGSGSVPVAVSIGGVTSNTVNITIQ
jgi:uncharacterized protein (TIGR03437 family)